MNARPQKRRAPTAGGASAGMGFVTVAEGFLVALSSEGRGFQLSGMPRSRAGALAAQPAKGAALAAIGPHPAPQATRTRQGSNTEKMRGVIMDSSNCL